MPLLPFFNLQHTVPDAQENHHCSNPPKVCLLHHLKPSFFVQEPLQAIHSFQMSIDSPKAHSHSLTYLPMYSGVECVLMPLSVPLYMQMNARSGLFINV